MKAESRLPDIDSIQKELDALNDRQKDLARRQEGFESQRARLLRAQRALEFGSTYASLVTLRKEQEADKHSLLENNAKVPALEAEVRRSEEALQLSVSAYSGRQADQKSLKELLRRVRELDLKQKEKEIPIRETQAYVEELAASLEAKRKLLDAEQAKFESTQVQMRDVRKFLQDNAADERLIEQFTGIKSRFDALGSFMDKRRRLSDERAAAEKLKKEAQKRLDGQNALHDAAKTKLASVENAIKKRNGALSEMLGSRSLAEWRESLSTLMERRVKLGKIEESFRQRAEISSALLELKSKKNALESSRRENNKKITARREKIKSLEKELQRIDIQTELIQRIEKLEEARGLLMNEQPCPLCGSTSHPYVVGSTPRNEEIRLEASRVVDDLKKGNDALLELNSENERLSEESALVETDEALMQSQIQDLERRLTDDLTTIQLILPKDVDPMAAIGMERSRSEERLQKVRLLVERADKDEEVLNSMRNELELLRQDRDQSASSRHGAEFEKETAVRELERLTQNIRLLDDELKNMRLDLTRQVIPFGYKSLPEDSPEKVLEALEARFAKWQEQHKLRMELEKRLTVWERDLHHERATLNSLNLELKEKNETIKKLKSEKDALKQQRISMFGGKDSDKEESKQKALVDKAEKQVEEKRESRALALQEFSNMNDRIDNQVKSIHIRAAVLQKAEISFKKQLIANGFSNEDAYLSACLPEAERKALQEHAAALDAEQAELEALIMDRRFSLEELRRQQVADFTPGKVS